MTDRELMQQALEALQAVKSTPATKDEIQRAWIVSDLLKRRLAKPDREWVGLTEEEVIDHFQTHVDTGSLLCFAAGARYAEAKLKEKNNG